MNGLKRGMEGAGERTHELKDRTIEITQSKQQREKNILEEKRTDTKGFVGL